MSWTQVKTEVWKERVAKQVERLGSPVGPSIGRFELIPAGLEEPASIHEGSLRIDGDFAPPDFVTAVFGDLDVSGRVSTLDVPDTDGGVTLIVFGALRGATLVNDWASLVLVSGDATVRDWTYAASEDSSFLVGGVFTTPIFIGADIWVTVGRDARMGSGIGYAMRMDEAGNDDARRIIRPAKDERATARDLKLGENEYAWWEIVEERFAERRTILPRD